MPRASPIMHAGSGSRRRSSCRPRPPSQRSTAPRRSAPGSCCAARAPSRLARPPTRRIVAALVGAVQLVTERQLESAVELLIERQKLIVEGAGAAGVAALLAEPERFRGRKVGIVLTGGNIDARLLASLLMRGLVRSGRLVRLRSELPDIPGVLSRVAGVIGGLGGNIVEVHHQRLFHDTSVKRAELDVVVETQNRRHVATIVDALVAAGFPTRLLSASEDAPDAIPAVSAS